MTHNLSYIRYIIYQSVTGETNKDWPEIYFNVEAMKQIGNIIFSNGHLDPWSSGGVLNQSDAGKRNPIFIIDQGAHHLDLRAS